MKHRLERLQARLSTLGSCPACNDRGVPGIRLEYIGPGEQLEPVDPPGCVLCGKVEEVSVVRFDSTPIEQTPLPGEPGAMYADE